jgi:F-type H+-transporting ATPase subunit delta
MIAKTAIARPYAKAVFALALRDQKLEDWQKTLDTLALVATECKKRSLLNNPGIGRKQEEGFFNDASKDFPDASSLIRILSERKKLEILPNIASNYQKLFFEHKKILEVKIVTAHEMNPEQKEKLENALQQQCKKQVSAHYQINNKLIGGAVIHVAGQLIDGSIKGKLQRLKHSLL